jgi:hypothetical protein
MTEDSMDGMRVDVTMCREAPDIRPLAQHIAEMAMAFFRDPENVQEYEAWKKAREAQKGA